MTWSEAFRDLNVLVVSREGLLSAGATGRDLTAAVQQGHLLRVRRDHYVLPGTPKPIIRAVRIGGRIGCLSALAHRGIFAIDSSATHVHLARTASRPRDPDRRNRPLGSPRGGATVHWGALIETGGGNEFSVGVSDALAQVVQCQESRFAIASLDNALFTGAIEESEVAEIFRHLPERFQPMRARIDGRAEAGQETVLRLALQDAGFHCDLQVILHGVGRVDLIVEGCVIVEADSRLAHDSWELHVRDRNRDIDAARLGYPTVRPAYGRTMSSTSEVVDAVRQLLLASHNFRVHV
ncbi:MAG: hypothetical protein KF761_06165 [Salinibacterium sp.]|nr:hypothetical protein [Salinibacterium sp.]